MTELTEKALEEAERICKNASPGPWEMWDAFEGAVKHRGLVFVDRLGDEGSHVLSTGLDPFCFNAKVTDWEFIAAAREGWPTAIAEVRRLWAENEALRKALKAYLIGSKECDGIGCDYLHAEQEAAEELVGEQPDA